jgi:hypothetical protein
MTEHLKAMQPHAMRLPFERLLHEQPVACVDGRNASSVIGAPGGNAGLFLLMVAAYEQFRHFPLAHTDADQLFEAYLASFGHFYLHSDTAALERLGAALEDHLESSPSFTSVEAVEAFLRKPPEEARSLLMDLLVWPEHVGCGHLRLILEQPDTYSVRHALMRFALRLFYQTLWAGDERLVFDVLDGDHAEEATLNIHAIDDGEAPLPMPSPNYEATQVFVHHPEAVAFMHRQHAAFLVDEKYLQPREETAFIAHQEKLGAAHLQATLQALAADLPTIDVHVTPTGEVTVD